MYNFEQSKSFYKNGIETPDRTEDNFKLYRWWYDQDGNSIDVQPYEGKTIVYYMKDPEISLVKENSKLVLLSFPMLTWEEFISMVDVESCIPAVDEGTVSSCLTPLFSMGRDGYSVTFLKEEDLKDKSLKEIQEHLFELYKKRRTTFLPFKWID